MSFFFINYGKIGIFVWFGLCGPWIIAVMDRPLFFIRPQPKGFGVNNTHSTKNLGISGTWEGFYSHFNPNTKITSDYYRVC